MRALRRNDESPRIPHSFGRRVSPIPLSLSDSVLFYVTRDTSLAEVPRSVEGSNINEETLLGEEKRGGELERREGRAGF